MHYQDELKYFVNNVCKAVIERCLIKDFATDIISTVGFGDMTDDQVRHLAAEPTNQVQKREQMENRKAILEAGQAAFRAALGAV